MAYLGPEKQWVAALEGRILDGVVSRHDGITFGRTGLPLRPGAGCWPYANGL